MASFFLQLACLALVGVVSGDKASFSLKMSFDGGIKYTGVNPAMDGVYKFFEPWKPWANCTTEVGGPAEPTEPVIVTTPTFSITPGKYSVTTVTEEFANTQGEQGCHGDHDDDFGWYMMGTAGSESFCNGNNSAWAVQVWLGPGVTGCFGSQTANFSGSNGASCSSQKIGIPPDGQSNYPAGVTLNMDFLLAIQGACNVPGSAGQTFSSAATDAYKARPGRSTTPSSSSSTCFPAQSTVQLDNGDMVRMDALQVGHKVQVGAKETSEVFMFSHQYTDAQATFVELTTAIGAIRLTPGHYLYVNGAATQARAVKIGDHLEAANGTPAVVTGVTQVRDTGLYNPHTMHGDVVVNGFRTTTYTDAIHPTMAHALLAPARAMYAMNVTF